MFAVYVPVHKKKLMFANMICDQPPATPKDHVCEHEISGHVQGHEPLPRPSWGYPMFRDMELYVREHKPSSCSRTWHVREHDRPSWRWPCQTFGCHVVSARASASERGASQVRFAIICGRGQTFIPLLDVGIAQEIWLQQRMGRANGFPCCQLSWLTKALRRDVVSAQLASAPSAAVAGPLHHPPTSVSREKPHCFSAWSAQTVFLRLQLWRHTGCADDTICIKQRRPQAAPSLIRDESGAWRMKPGTFGYVWAAHG